MKKSIGHRESYNDIWWLFALFTKPDRQEIYHCTNCCYIGIVKDDAFCSMCGTEIDWSSDESLEQTAKRISKPENNVYKFNI